MDDAIWDIICIGSGITALAFAAQLVARHPGKRILILEKHYLPGGYATVFRRKRSRFDCSLHKLSGMGEGGNARRILEQLGLAAELEFIYPAEYFEADWGAGTLTLGSDYEVYKRQLRERFPEEAGLEELFAELELHGRQGYYQFQILDGSYPPDLAQLRFAYKHLRRISVADRLGQLIRSPLLRELLAAPTIYTGGFAEDLSYLYYLHLLYATLVRKCAYIRRGSQHLSNALVQRVKNAGGDVKLRTTVKRILVDGEHRAHGVETDRGTFLGRQIYTNASPQHALSALLPPLDCLAPVRQKVGELKPSWATTTLYVVADQPPEALGLTSGETMLLSERFEEASALRRACRSSPGDGRAFEHALWEASPMEVTDYHRLDPSGGHVLCLNVLDSIEHWPARGTREYEAKKARAGEVLLERLLRHRPGLRGHVQYQEGASPHTYERYTNNPAGAGYGVLVGPDAVSNGFHFNFPIRGLHFLSSWVAGSGYEAAFGYAEMKAQTYQDAERVPVQPPPRHS